MKDRKEKIDLLFERNAADELAKVDWDELNTAISSRLDEAGWGKTSAVGYRRVFKIAAGVAAAAIVFIVLMIGTNRPADVQRNDGRSAVVKFIETKGSASIEIKQPAGKSQVTVDIGGSGRKIASCDVEIIESNGGLKERDSRAAWIIISRPEPMFVDNGVSTDMMDMIYLF